MHTRRHFLRYTATAAAAPLLTACAPSHSPGAAGEATVLRHQGSPGAVSFPELAVDLGYLDGVALEWVGDTTSGPQSIQAAATGDTGYGGAFNGAILKLVAAGAPVTAVLAYYGSDETTYSGYYVPEDSPLTGARDLVGAKVAMNTLGAHHEFVVREWLARNGLTGEEAARVELTVVPPVNAEQALRSGQVDVATLSGVHREKALERGGLRPLFTDTDLHAFSYGSIVLRNDFIERDPAATRAFVEGVSRAIRWTQTRPREEVVDRFVAVIERRGRNEDTETIQYWKSDGVAGPGGVIAEREFSVWHDWLVRNGELAEGRIALADVYTNEFNPYANGTYAPNSGPDGEPVSAAPSAASGPHGTAGGGR
ncbi:ABC transporter substrate-binding protein [Thermobifida alba]|uniref:ABC transporter substrate-binding protein n=1 Tax=Thermobifida alba TaxID=53522 RepID=A0ABY4KZL2_THEAE|nr:ABC transporter substrate-binding protein [Thermobifida alba]UPT20878.1 ABC transporter substrate-binding protein [Thermobifida alba]HLU95674.1 ABC transporter substrate-binding protein [Thermobifida alba]